MEIVITDEELRPHRYPQLYILTRLIEAGAPVRLEFSHFDGKEHNIKIEWEDVVTRRNTFDDEILLSWRDRTP